MSGMSATFQALTIRRRESGLVFDLLDYLRNLIHGFTVCPFPGTPLLTIDRSEIAFLVCPLIPNADPIFLQVLDVGIALQKPQEFVEYGGGVTFLGGHEGEPFG